MSRHLVAIGLLLCLPCAAYCAPVMLNTPQGKLLGTTGEPSGGVRTFKGVPYALPPTGIRRWTHAEHAPAWTGVRLANAYGPDCMQPAMPETNFLYHPIGVTSEDCLYLNVWTPTTARSGSLPVMVWIHGGGLFQGAGSWPLYDGTELARKGVVVVTFNYRLGIFGYFAHPALAQESSHRTSGNYGTTDQILALKWLRDNIAAFGGDPANITIFGESAGAVSVLDLMTSPLARDLFHRAIAQSGMMAPLSDLKAAESNGLEFSQALNRKTLPDLRSLPASTLLSAAMEKGWNAHENRAIDGWVLTDQVRTVFAKGAQHDVPLIVGFNSDEHAYGLHSLSVTSREDYLKEVSKRHGEMIEEYLSFYPADDWERSAYRAWRDAWAVPSMEGAARMMGRVSSAAYLYYFGHVVPGTAGAFHTAEIAYVFNNEKHGARYSPNLPSRPPRQRDLALADTMSDYWVAFAKSGVPAAEGLPQWQPYSETARHYMEFKDGRARPAMGLLPGVWELHERIGARGNSNEE